MKKLSITFIMSVLIIATAYAQKGQATISGKINSLNDRDIVKITVKEFGNNLRMFDKEYDCVLVNNAFRISIPCPSHPLQIAITYHEKTFKYQNGNKLNRLALSDYFLEREDDVNFTENSGAYKFSGKGAGKFSLIQRLNKISLKYGTGFSYVNPHDILIHFEKDDSAYVEKVRLIDLHKKSLSANVYNLIKADIISVLYSKSSYIKMMNDSAKRIASALLSDYECTIPARYLALNEFNKSDILKYSEAYTYWGIPEKYYFEACYLAKKEFSIGNYFDYVKNNFVGGLRERLLTNLMIAQLDSSGSVIPYVDTALKILKFPIFINTLNELKNHRKPGVQAFNFNLPDSSGVHHSLSDFKGKVVLMDFWFTGCGSCADAKPFVEKVEEHFKDKQVVFITINFDRNKSTWIKAIKSSEYTSNYGINLFTEGQAFDHPIAKYYNIYGGPDFIMIDKNGNLTENPKNPRFDNGAQLTALIERELSK